MLGLIFILGTINASAIDINVGDIRTCTLSSPPTYLQGCQWTISDTNAMEFVTPPSKYSTSVDVRAKAPQSTISPVIVHCTYYYLELDPITGRYTYSRSGGQDWYFFIKDNRPQSVNVYPSNLTMHMGDTPYILPQRLIHPVHRRM